MRAWHLPSLQDVRSLIATDLASIEALSAVRQHELPDFRKKLGAWRHRKTPVKTQQVKAQLESLKDLSFDLTIPVPWLFVIESAWFRADNPSLIQSPNGEALIFHVHHATAFRAPLQAGAGPFSLYGYGACRAPVVKISPSVAIGSLGLTTVGVQAHVKGRLRGKHLAVK